MTVRSPIQAGDGDPRHGASGYTNHRCRCPICREGHRVAVADYMARHPEQYVHRAEWERFAPCPRHPTPEVGVSGEPFPKSSQLARGERRYRRRVASPKQWQAIREAKIGPCRVCCNPASNGRLYGRIQLHHLLSRAQGGDDVADNIVPLCLGCHGRVTRRERLALYVLAAMLTKSERAYVIGKIGQGRFERLYGVGR